jgi:HSP20 family protein
VFALDHRVILPGLTFGVTRSSTEIGSHSNPKGGIGSKMLWSDPFAMFPVARGSAFLPPADVTVSSGDLVLTLDLPGLTTDDIDIELVDDALTVRGARKRSQVADGTTWALAERAFGAFERTFRVPRGVDPDSIAATVEHGVLSLIIPKPERLQPKRIAVGTQRELETSAA